MELIEANFRIVVRANDEKGLGAGVEAVRNLMLFGGHGVGVAPPGGPLPQVDTWSIYAKARSVEEAEGMIEEAVSDIEGVAVVVSIEAFDPGAAASR